MPEKYYFLILNDVENETIIQTVCTFKDVAAVLMSLPKGYEFVSSTVLENYTLIEGLIEDIADQMKEDGCVTG